MLTNILQISCALILLEVKFHLFVSSPNIWTLPHFEIISYQSLWYDFVMNAADRTWKYI